MFTRLKQLKTLLTRGDELSKKVKKNILISSFFRVVSIVSSFVLVPLTLDYIGVKQFGIWLTISSIIHWFGYMDMGMGNGMKNKLAAALALKDYENARTYVSTTYAGLFLIFLPSFLIFMAINPFLDWASILNAEEVGTHELFLVVSIVCTFFLSSLVLRLIGTVLNADNRSGISDSIAPISNVLSLLIIYILTITTEGSLLYVSLAYAGMPPVLYLVLTIFFFTKDYKFLRPSIKYLKFSYFKGIANLGLKFMVLQLSVLVIFTTDNLIITRLLGPEHVTPYNIAHRYFNLVVVPFGIILKPTWAAYVNAFAREDYNWIKRVMRKMLMLLAGLSVIVLIMVAFSNPFYKFWVGDKVSVDLSLSFLMGLSIIFASMGRTYAMLLNATEKIKMQMIVTLVGAAINIPLSIFFAGYLGMGSLGVILATCVSIFPATLIYPYQYNLIMKKKDKGIWAQ